MSDAFRPPHSSPEHPAPHDSPPEYPAHHNSSPSYPTYPTHPAYPAHRAYPTRPAYPTHPAYPTYPWQPPPPRPPRQRLPRHPPLGHHSDLRLLRSAYRWQRRVATLTALGYFTLFLALSAFAPAFMTGTVSGGLTTGLLLGLLQVPVTCLAIGLYEYTARRTVDPIAGRIRTQATLDARREAAR